MKKILTIALSVCLFASLTGCKKNKKVTEFKYDGKGYMQKAMIHSKESTEEIGEFSRKDLIYNEKNLLVYDIEYLYVMKNKKPVYDIYKMDEYEYNDNNQLIRVIYKEKDEDTDSLKPRGKSVYKYTSNNLTTSEFHHYNGSSYFLTAKNEMTYDSNNNLLTDTSYTHSDGSMTMDHKIEYTYNTSNQVIKEEHFGRDSFKLLSYSYTYDDNGNKTLEEYDDYKDIILKHKFEYEYDSNNNLVKKYYYAGGNDGSANYTLDEKEEYTYNSLNNISTYKKYILFNNEFVLHINEDYTYDASNKLTKKASVKNYCGNNRDTTITATYDYEYIEYK